MLVTIVGNEGAYIRIIVNSIRIFFRCIGIAVCLRILRHTEARHILEGNSLNIIGGFGYRSNIRFRQVTPVIIVCIVNKGQIVLLNAY